VASVELTDLSAPAGHRGALQLVGFANSEGWLEHYHCDDDPEHDAEDASPVCERDVFRAAGAFTPNAL
jgi:hypothetical protein